jgi:hypothetical protein
MKTPAISAQQPILERETICCSRRRWYQAIPLDSHMRHSEVKAMEGAAPPRASESFVTMTVWGQTIKTRSPIVVSRRNWLLFVCNNRLFTMGQYTAWSSFESRRWSTKTSHQGNINNPSTTEVLYRQHHQVTSLERNNSTTTSYHLKHEENSPTVHF